MSFLKAEWRKLAIANYSIDPQILDPYLPAGTNLDIWDNKCYVSLVGFMFLNTKLLGLKIPYHVDFEEVNIRFYVKRETPEGERRGVVFIKEIVPRPALAFVANTIYKENYESMKMKHLWTKEKIEYNWKKGNTWNSFEVNYDDTALSIKPDSEIEFITEHYWGYAKINSGKTNEYEVTHPKWEHYKVNGYSIDVDFGEIYGEEFAFLNSTKPTSVMLAEGSLITVEIKNSLKF